MDTDGLCASQLQRYGCRRFVCFTVSMDTDVLCAWQLDRYGYRCFVRLTERYGYKCFVLFVREVWIQMFCALDG